MCWSYNEASNSIIRYTYTNNYNEHKASFRRYVVGYNFLHSNCLPQKATKITAGCISSELALKFQKLTLSTIFVTLRCTQVQYFGPPRLWHVPYYRCFKNGPSRPLFVYFRLSHNKHFKVYNKWTMLQMLQS